MLPCAPPSAVGPCATPLVAAAEPWHHSCSRVQSDTVTGDSAAHVARPADGFVGVVSGLNGEWVGMWDWLNCALLFRHDYGVWTEKGAIYLRCLRCGHRSHGWDIEHRDSGHDTSRGAPLRAAAILVRRVH